VKAPPLRRAFTAVVWNQAEAEALCALQRTLRELHPDPALRWADPVDLHCTLRYYGDVDAELHAALAHSLAAHAQRSRASTLELDCLECWPPARPRVLVACLHAPPPLLALQAALEREALALGFAPDPHAFRAHATLARIAPEWNGALVRAKLAAFTLPATQIALWYSRLASSGPHYAEAAQQPLSGGSPRA
jgi:RNA 2',3'-cyclic 3'-phosphodiesterase